MDKLTIRTNSASPEILAHRAKAMLKVEKTCRSQVQWYETSTVAEYRRLRAEGIGFPALPVYEDSRTVTIDATGGHTIQLRVINCHSHSKGVLLHFHAGGFVIGSSKSYDNYLVYLSKSLGLSVVSVEYRLAPEHPYPAAHDDAINAARYALTPAGEAELGGPLKVLAGESAGGYLATWVVLELRQRYGVDVRAQLSALVASYPIYDMTYTPSLLSHQREAVLSREGMQKFVDVAFPGMRLMERKHPGVSLLYADLDKLPPALFLCGTEDPLVDDSVFMANRWALAGNTSELCLIPGAWHAFTLIPAGEVTNEGLLEVTSFVKRHI